MSKRYYCEYCGEEIRPDKPGITEGVWDIVLECNESRSWLNISLKGTFVKAETHRGIPAEICGVCISKAIRLAGARRSLRDVAKS